MGVPADLCNYDRFAERPVLRSLLMEAGKDLESLIGRIGLLAQRYFAPGACSQPRVSTEWRLMEIARFKDNADQSTHFSTSLMTDQRGGRSVFAAPPSIQYS